MINDCGYFQRFGWMAIVVVLLGAGAVDGQSPISVLAFSPADKSVLSASIDNLEVYTWPELKLRNRHELNLRRVQVAEFSPNGKLLLLAGGRAAQNGKWQVVSWPDMNIVASEDGYDDVIYAATWLSDQQVAIAGDNNRLLVFGIDGAKPRLVARLNGHSRRILDVVYCHSQQQLVSTGIDQSLRVWSADTTGLTKQQTSPLRVLDNHLALVRDIAVRPDSSPLPYVASASADKTVRLWQPSIGRLVRFARIPVEPLCLAWSHDGQQIAVGCTDGKLRILNPNTVQIESEIDTPIDGWIYAVAAASDGSFVIGGRTGKPFRIFVPHRHSAD